MARFNRLKCLGPCEKVAWERTNEGLVVRLPEEKPCSFAYVLKIQ